MNNKSWKKFSFVDIFDIKKGFYNKKPIHFDSESNRTIPFLSGTFKNNGISCFYSENEIKSSSRTGSGKNEALERKIFNGNCIVVTNNGSIGYAYYQKQKFTCSHDVNPLYLKDHTLTLNIAMFLITAIEKQRVCYEYARKWRPSRMTKSYLMLPINRFGKPDFLSMDLYISELRFTKLQHISNHIKFRLSKLNFHTKNNSVNDLRWKDFSIDEIAEIYSGKDIYKKERKLGETPYISSTSNNNGVGHFVANMNKTYDTKCVSVNRNGSVGYAFVHDYPALFSNDCRKLKLKFYSRFIALFVANQITAQKSKYGYGYKMGTARLKKQRILLPCFNDHLPNYEFMDNFIKVVEYNKLTKYLNYIKQFNNA